MKSERRHELEKNQLAQWLADFITKMKPYQNIIATVCIVAAIILLVLTWSARQSNAASARGWDRFFRLFGTEEVNPAEFDQIAKLYPDTKLAQWSTVISADLHLSDGCEDLFVNKVDALESLRQARSRYKDILDESLDPMLESRAMFGLARTLEAQGELKKAIEGYEKVAETWADGPFGAVAAERLKSLKAPKASEWYEQFEEYAPQEAFASEPGVPGERPLFDSDSLTEPPAGNPMFLPPIDRGPAPGEIKMPSLDPSADDDAPAKKPTEEPADKPTDESTDKPVEDSAAAEETETESDAGEKKPDEKPPEDSTEKD